MPAAHPVPFVAPEIVAGRIQREILAHPHQANPHLGVLAPTRGGKDYFVRHVVLGMAKPLAKSCVMDVKPWHDRSACGAPGCKGLGDQTWCGWGRDVGEGGELEALPEHLGAGRWRLLVPLGDDGAPIVESAVERFGEVGEMLLVLSDSGRLTEPKTRGGLNLGGKIARLMSEKASIGLSVIAMSTSAAWAESGIKDQTAAVLVGHVVNLKMRNTFAELAGLPKYARPALDSLGPRQFLYADYRGAEAALAITSAGG